jgi:outer membrane autotransporter protein
LVAAGAPTISFLAGNTGELPEVAGNPGVAAIRSAYSQAFNQGLQTALAGYAADGVIVHYLDLSLVLAQVSANPSAYGLNALVCPAFPNPTCVANAGAGYLFYGDLLHPTSQGSAIIAQYVATQLAAPLTLQAPSDLAQDIAQQFGRTLSTRADFGLDESEPGKGGLSFFLVGDTFARDVEESDDNDAFDIDGVGLTGGAEMAFAGGVAGLAVNYTRPRVRFGNDNARINGRTLQIGGYAGAKFGDAFAHAHVGAGWDKHRIKREGVVEDMAAWPRGTHVTAGVDVGYLMPMGQLKIGPVAELDYARAKVKGYTEEGDPALTLNVGRQTLRSFTGAIGVEAQADLTAGGAGVKPFVSAMLEREFSGDDRSIEFAQTSAPVIINRWDVSGSPETYGRLSAGFSAELFGGLSINAAVSGTVGQNSGDELGAHLGLRTGF